MYTDHHYVHILPIIAQYMYDGKDPIPIYQALLCFVIVHFNALCGMSLKSVTLLSQFTFTH